MPWCPECDRFYNPNSLKVDGTCPTCGRGLGEEEGAGDPAQPESFRKFSDEPAPWHFKVLIVVVSIYLSYRLIQGIVWVGHHA